MGYELSGEIALKNNHYYFYYYYYFLQHVVTLCFTYTDDDDDGPNGSCHFAAGSPPDTVDSQNYLTFSTRQIAYLVAERPMPALLLRLLLQCAGDIEMNPGPVSTPTPTNCLRLIKWNANGISEKLLNC